MGRIADIYHNELRPCRKVTDMFLLAFYDTVFGVEGSIGAVILLLLLGAGLVAYAKRRNFQAPDLWGDA